MKQSLLWKVSKTDHMDSYLFGTMHVKSKQVFQRITQLDSVINDIDLFAAEYHLDRVQFVQKPTDLMVPEGRSQRDYLGERKFRRMQRIVEKSFRVDLSQFEYYLPLLVVNVIAEAILSKDFKLSLDQYLWKLAKEKGKKLEGVETYASQQEIMQKIKLEDQLKMLKDIARNPSKYRRSVLKMADWYQNEEINKLYKNGKKSLGKYRYILLKRRNLIMASRMENLSKQDRVFFAIGAGHLGGEIGILKLLKEMGWKLSPL